MSRWKYSVWECHVDFRFVFLDQTLHENSDFGRLILLTEINGNFMANFSLCKYRPAKNILALRFNL